MNSLKEKIVDISTSIERQLPSFVVEDNPKFVSFLSSYYESQESKYNYLDIIKNFIEYYNIGHYSPNTLVSSTKLSSSITDSTTTITVVSTIGFPDTNGYISINGEYIFYRTKTETQFVDCVRGTSAFILENAPFNQIVYKTGVVASSHASGSEVGNVGYSFAIEFLRRIKSEISPTLPENLTPELDIASFLKNIKSFYLAKGSERSHQILFRILFNDRKLKLKLVPSGSGARIDILNYTGNISAFQLVSGGTGYYYELDGNQNLVSPPIIDILGSGTGLPDQFNQVPTTAQMIVDGMDSDGSITSVQVTNAGQNYIGPITARVRARSFTQGQKIINENPDGVTTGSARVDSWDSGSEELILTDIVGYFRIGDKIIGEGGENPRSFVAKAYPVTDINKEGNPSIETISQDAIIEYPKDYLIKPSSATYYEKKVVRCELLENYNTTKNLDDIKFIELVQSRDLTNKIPGTTLEITEISRVSDNVYEFEVGNTPSYKKLYLPSSTQTTQSAVVTSSTNSTITVTSTFNFPHKEGKLFINDKIIQYESKTDTQFINCTLTTTGSISISSGTNVYLYGRQCLTAGEVTYFIKGYIDGDRTSTPILFRLHALPSAPVIVSGGSLYKTDIFELDPETTYKLNKTTLSSKKYNYGEINKVIIENVGDNYQVNDKVVINNEGNLGSNFNAQITSIAGRSISSYQLVTLNGKSCIQFTTSVAHGLTARDTVRFSHTLNTQTVYAIVSSTQFAIENLQSLTTLNLTGLTYITNSKTAKGPIDVITITNKGKNYTKLPEVTGFLTTDGFGALVQLDSDTIGSLSKFEYASIGNELIGNKTTQYPVIVPSTAKLINNFQIANIVVTNGGNNYNPNTDVVKVDGVINPNCEFKIITSSGVITEIQVIKGGFNFTAIPTITVESTFGTGAVVSARIKRKILEQNDILTFGSVGSGVTCRVVNFDVPSSTLEFYPVSGTISENDSIYTFDDNIYGNIVNIRKASAYCKLSAYSSYSYKFLDNFGFISDSTQRIIDSDYYQNWSYSLVSQRNTSEWKDEVITNTHPSGYKVFGKYRAENTKKFFERQEDVFNSSVIFKATLSNLVNTQLNISDNDKLFTEYIESNSVKNYRSLYEITKKILDGTVYSDNLNVYGFDTSFYKTYPEYSSSYVEVLNTIQFDGVQKIFTLTNNNGSPYTPGNGKINLLVSVNNNVLSPSEYTVVGNQIEFLNSSAYLSSDKCTIIDFISSYNANNLNTPGITLDDLNVVQDGSRDTFNLSDSGVPQYVKNIGDLFVIKNGVLQKPSSETYTIPSETNKIKFVTAPSSTDTIKLLDFVRQVSPENTKNVLIDSFRYYDGIETEFPITVDGILFSPVDVHNLFVILNGVQLKPGIDYTIINQNYIKFSSPPPFGSSDFVFYSYNGLNVNYPVSITEVLFDSQTSKYPLTKNFVSTTVESSSHLIVLRNGVYQFPDTDYTIDAGPSIVFSTNPSQEETINIINFKNSSDFVDISSRFVKNPEDDVYTISYIPTSPEIQTNLFLIFINGILQTPDSWSFNNITNKLIFGGFVSLQLDNIKIFAFRNSKRILDSFTVSSGVSTYDLSVSGTQISTNLPQNEEDLLVIINGVIQDPRNSYTITSNTITLNTPIAGEIVYIYQVGDSTYPVELVDYLDGSDLRLSSGINYIYRLMVDYTSINILVNSDLIVLRNGVVQTPSIDYVLGNGYITFNDEITTSDDIFTLRTHGTNNIGIVSIGADLQTITLNTAIDSSEYKNLVLYVNGVPQFYGIDFTMSNSTTAVLVDMKWDLNVGSIFALQYSPITFIDSFNDVQDGVNTTFKILYNGSNITVDSNADLLVSYNGVIQYLGVDYTINQTQSIIDFNVAPQFTDKIFIVRMLGNEIIDLTPVSGNTYTLSTSISTFDRDNLIIFSNNEFKFNELTDYQYISADTVTLSSPHTVGRLFGIKFYGVIKLLDEINTPFNDVNTTFNLFYDQENYMPNGTIDVDNVPSETNLLVFKNGKLLDSSSDYTLQGNSKTQIQFTVAPSSTDIIFIKSFGAFTKINNITPTGAKIYNLVKGSSSYYPNANIKRPRDLENQILVAKDGELQSPLYDYYIENDKLKFNFNVTGSKITVIDFMGTSKDVHVDSVANDLNTNDIIFINGEENERLVDKILSPTVLTTKEIIKNGNLISGNTYIVKELDGSPTNLKIGDSFIATSKIEDGIVSCISTNSSLEGLVASGFVGQVSTTNESVSNIAVLNPGVRYTHPVIIRTLGSGVGAKATASIDKYNSYGILNPIIQYAGYNVLTTSSQEVIPTSYIYTYKETLLNSSTVRKATYLSSSINSTVRSIPVANTANFEKNPPTINVTYKTNPSQIATFRPYVSNGRIIKVDILTAGSGYDDRDAQLEVTGGGGSGCVLELILDSSGSVSNVLIQNSGEGYDVNRVIINDEIIEYTDFTSTQLLGCTRGSNPSSHSQNDVVYFDKFI